MPIYEYECAVCGRVVEKWQKISDEPLTTCSCGGSLSKLISNCSFSLKGSGWYVTDYAGKMANSNAAGTSKDSGSGTATAAESPKAAPEPAAPAKKFK